MNSKCDFINLTESDRILNITNEKINHSFNDPYIPIQTETYLGVRNIISKWYIVLNRLA